MKSEVSHNEIYERLCLVETKTDTLTANTADMLAAFHAAQGAFTVLEWIAKITKPLIYVGSIVAAIAAMWHQKS